MSTKKDSHKPYAINDRVTRPEWMGSVCRVCGQWVVPADTPAACRPCPGYLIEAPTPAGPFPKHRRRRNGQCYATCPVCVKEQRKTEQTAEKIFYDIGSKIVFSLGFGYGIASLRRHPATYRKMARSLPSLFRNLALGLPLMNWGLARPRQKNEH